MALDEKQRGVARGILIAGLVSLAGIALAIAWRPGGLIPAGGVGERLVATLKWDVLLAVCFVLAIGRLAQHRFFTPADIDGSGLTSGTDRARVMQAVVQNTLEQTLIAVLAHLVWTAATPAGWYAAVPVAVLLFVVGRISFAAGYAGGAPARAYGFGQTFYPSVMLILGALGCIGWSLLSGNGG